MKSFNYFPSVKCLTFIKIKSLFLLFLFVSQFCIFSCKSNYNNTTQKVEGETQMTTLTIEQVQKKYQDQIMTIPGVVGIGIGAKAGKKIIKVMVVKKDSTIQRQVPEELEGFPVEIEETGKIQIH